MSVPPAACGSIQVLNYATPGASGRGLPHFRAIVFLMGAIGVAANIRGMWSTVHAMHRAAWVYHDLMQDHRAYGREISPAIIATLREPAQLWVAEILLVGAAAFGLLLAIHLLLAAVGLNRNPANSLRQFQRYSRWKVIGTLFTASAFVWCDHVTREFWVAATRHVTIGSGPPVFATTALVGCALVPVWWVRTGIRGRTAAVDEAEDGATAA